MLDVAADRRYGAGDGASVDVTADRFYRAGHFTTDHIP